MKAKKNNVVLRIDDQMSTMDWLKKFKRKLDTDKLDYKDNEYESSGFDPLNIVISERIQDKKKDNKLQDKLQSEGEF